MKELTSRQIELFASRPGAKRIAVENFLGTIGTKLRYSEARSNLMMDARSYHWNKQTIQAIDDGLKVANKGAANEIL